MDTSRLRAPILAALRELLAECLDCCAAEATIEGIHERIADRIRRLGEP